MLFKKLNLSLPVYLKFACVLISIIILGYLAKEGKTILVPLILGFLFAMLLIPFASFLERKLNMKRTFATITSVVLFFGIILLLFYLITTQLMVIKEDWPAFQQQMSNAIAQFQHWISNTFHVKESEQLDYLNKTASSEMSTGTALVGTALLSISSLFIFLVFTFIYTFFLLLYRRHLVKFLLFLNKQEHRPIVLDIVQQVQYVVKKYLVGLMMQMLIVAILVFIALSIIGVKYSMLLAIITGIFNVLPYIGIFTSMFIIAIITFATASVSHVIFVVIAIIIIHAIDSNYILPKIVGSKVRVNSLFALLSIVIGEMIWGISGMFLAIPILAIVKIIFDRVKGLMPWGYLLGDEADKDNVLNNPQVKVISKEE